MFFNNKCTPDNLTCLAGYDIPPDYFNEEKYFYIQASMVKNVLSIHLIGDFNYKYQRMFRDYCIGNVKHMIQDHIDTIELDFSRLQMIDSTGLGALLLVKNSLDPNLKLNIVNCSHAVYDVLKITMFHRFFNIIK